MTVFTTAFNIHLYPCACMRYPSVQVAQQAPDGFFGRSLQLHATVYWSRVQSAGLFRCASAAERPTLVPFVLQIQLYAGHNVFAHWPMREGIEARVIFDHTGNGHNGVCRQGKAWGATWHIVEMPFALEHREIEVSMPLSRLRLVLRWTEGVRLLSVPQKCGGVCAHAHLRRPSCSCVRDPLASRNPHMGTRPSAFAGTRPVAPRVRHGVALCRRTPPKGPPKSSRNGTTTRSSCPTSKCLGPPVTQVWPCRCDARCLASVQGMRPRGLKPR